MRHFGRCRLESMKFAAIGLVLVTAACASAPPMKTAEIVDRIGSREDQAVYPRIAIQSVNGDNAEIVSGAIAQALSDQGALADEEHAADYRLSVRIVRVDEEIAKHDVQVEMDAAFELLSASPDGTPWRRRFQEIAIRTIPGGRQSGQIALDNAARAATQMAAIVAAGPFGLAAVVPPNAKVPPEYRAMRDAKQDAIAGLIRQFLGAMPAK